MAAPTITRGDGSEQGGARALGLLQRIDDLGSAPEQDGGRLDAIALGLVDALLARDEHALWAALDACRAARARALGEAPASGERGPLLASLDVAAAVAHWGTERLTSEASLAALGEGTRAHAFLRALDQTPVLGSSELRGALGTDETQVSRTGRQLLEAGLVTRRKVGRRVFWELTPRGRQALELAPAAPAGSATESTPDGTTFWFDALRRGFEGAGGDQPGQARTVDPTRERIVECTRALHVEQGVAATTWPEIASRAGVREEELNSLFPTTDDLVRGCGQHIFMDLRLPPPDRAANLFAEATSGGSRVEQLVGALFGAYERGGSELEIARSERAALPLLGEGLDSLDVALDALVEEALGSRSGDPGAVASVRALTDLAVWRTRREQGASQAEAAQQTSVAVERWLEAHPSAAGSRAHA